MKELSICFGLLEGGLMMKCKYNKSLLMVCIMIMIAFGLSACGTEEKSMSLSKTKVSVSSQVEKAAENGALAILQGDVRKADMYVYNDTSSANGVNELATSMGELFQYLPGGVASISVSCRGVTKISDDKYDAYIVLRDPSSQIPMHVDVVRTSDGWKISCASFFMNMMMNTH